MKLLQKMKEVLMVGPLKEVELRLEESLTTEDAIADVTTHLVQLLAKHKVERTEVPMMQTFQLSFWTRQLPDGKMEIRNVTFTDHREIPSGVKNEDSFGGR